MKWTDRGMDRRSRGAIGLLIFGSKQAEVEQGRGIGTPDAPLRPSPCLIASAICGQWGGRGRAGYNNSSCSNLMRDRGELLRATLTET
jgi:hypothetical protein